MVGGWIDGWVDGCYIKLSVTMKGNSLEFLIINSSAIKDLWKLGFSATKQGAWELLKSFLFVCFVNEIQSPGSLLKPAAEDWSLTLQRPWICAVSALQRTGKPQTVGREKSSSWGHLLLYPILTFWLPGFKIAPLGNVQRNKFLGFSTC